MIAISMWEPWASLVRTLAKCYETRHWATQHRGPLLICAAKRKTDVQEYLTIPEFQAGLAPLVGLPLNLKATYTRVTPRVWMEDLSFGKAVAIVNLVDCIPTDKMTRKQIGEDFPFGDFRQGRFAWKLSMIRRDFTPFPVKGKQGFFHVDDKLINYHLNLGALPTGV